MAETILWEGATGTKYKYWIHPLPVPNWEPEAGSYVFAKKLSNGNLVPTYAGETEDLSERFDNHHAMPCITSNDATHITVHTTSSGGAARRAEEKDIRDKQNPPCNKQ